MSTKNLGDTIELQKQDVKVVACNNCGAHMVWLKMKDLQPGDLLTLKRLGIKLTNPHTEDQLCIDCEIKREQIEHEEKRKVSSWFNTAPSHHDSDSGFSFGGGGGFGGGMFSGGGATGGW